LEKEGSVLPVARVLVVEDEPVTAKEIQRSLEKLGYSVAAVTDNGLDAINLARQMKPDLILMDIVLKGPVDGIKASAKIREQNEIPIVYLTAHQDDKTLERSRQTNPYGYLLKPLNERDLNSCLRMALYRHETERKLRESEERFNALTEVALSAIFIISGDKFIYANPHSETLTGYTFRELKNLNFWDIVHPDFKDMVKERGLARQRGENVPNSYEFKIITKSGAEKWVQTSATLTEYEGKKCTLAIVFDVTDRKTSEENLRQSEERYRVFIGQSTEGIYRIEVKNPIPVKLPADEQVKLMFKEFYIAECNDSMAKMYGFGSAREMIGKKVSELLLVDDPANYKMMNDFVQNHYRIIDSESHEVDSAGSNVFFSNNAVGIIENGNLVGAWGIQADITERKKSEEALKHSLREKEILLKEIHHRVKNNLQIVTSLLKLQSSYVDDEKVKQLFKESQNRVQSMALIHQKLYQTKDLSHIDFKEYIETLALHLQHSYGVLEDKVKIVIDVKNLEMPIDNAVPAGLIINELISNSLKYAFPDRMSGKLFINLAFDDFEKEYWLSVRDTGIGLPKDFDFRNANTFGLKLVTALAGQMGGTIELVSSGGCEFRITFKSSDYKERE
jgi:PAS domain S-box-containing protein